MFKTKSGRILSYNGREYTKDINKISDDFNNINSIDELFELLLNVWCKETAYPGCQNDYNHEEDPTYGQCAITATLVHDLFGGTIHKIRIGDGTHYFNKINNHFIDLTSDQFNYYNIPIEYEPNEEIPREVCNKNEDTLNRFNLMITILNNNTSK